MVGLLLIIRAVHIGAAILLFAVFVFSLAVGQPVFATPMEGGALDFFHRFECRLLRVALWSLAISFASGALWLWIEAAEMSERSLANALALDVVGTLLRQTQFGHCWTLRLMLVILIAALWPALPRTGKPNQSMWIGPRLIAGLLAGALLATLAFVGHAAASEEPVRLFHLTADATHLLAAGVWPGGLVPFTMLLARVQPIGETKVPTFVSSITQRFSQVNFVMIGIIGATGVVNSWLLVSTFDAVLTSTYGRLLLLKLMLFAAMIALGAVNRYRLRPRLMPDSGKSYRALRALKRNVKFELCAGVAVILIVGAMGISAPPRHQD